MENENKGNIVIYQSNDGLTKIDVKFEAETVWLTQQQMAELYKTSRTNVVEHIKHIYEEGEPDESSTCRNFRQVQTEGKRQVTRELPFVSAYFDLAEINAMEHKKMYMSDYVEQLDNVIKTTGKNLLDNAGSISHKQAIEKAEGEYQRFIQKNLSPVEESYLNTIRELNKTAKENK